MNAVLPIRDEYNEWRERAYPVKLKLSVRSSSEAETSTLNYPTLQGFMESEYHMQLIEGDVDRVVDVFTNEKSAGISIEAAQIDLVTSWAMNEREKGLELKIRFLEHQLQSDTPHLRLYRLGAAGFLASMFSLTVWYFTGIGAPFHPVFSGLSIPVSIGVMVMAFLVRRGNGSMPNRER